MAYTSEHAILGGTFDHFHIGHEQFISTAFTQSKNITIGVVEKLFSANKSHPNIIDNYEHRISYLESYLKSMGLLSRSNIITINDIYGTSLTDRSIDTIFVTDSTHQGAQKINIERQKLGLSPLSIVPIPYVFGDDGKIISSSRIRSGLIDRLGHSYLKSLLSKPIYHLPDSLRSTLQIPLGTILKDPKELTKIVPPNATIISVGDIVSMDLQKAGYSPAVSVVDFHTRRRSLSPQDIETHFATITATTQNPAGTINSQFAPIFLSALKDLSHPQIIKIEGEEDLLALPVVLLAPLGSYLIYGQYDVGMCVVIITEELKDRVKNLLTQFD